MGIFNEQSFDDPFAKGIQGAPGGQELVLV